MNNLMEGKQFLEKIQPQTYMLAKREFSLQLEVLNKVASQIKIDLEQHNNVMGEGCVN